MLTPVTGAGLTTVIPLPIRSVSILPIVSPRPMPPGTAALVFMPLTAALASVPRVKGSKTCPISLAVMPGPVSSISNTAISRAYSTSKVLPTASSTRNDAASNAVFATRSADHLRNERGVKRSAKSSIVSRATQLL